MSPTVAEYTFIKALEAGEGWETCQEFCHTSATFSYQTEPAVKTMSLASYAEWMRILMTSIPDARYILKSFKSHTIQDPVFAKAEFYGAEFGAGGPIPPVRTSVIVEYAYVMEFYDGKICHLTKAWSDVHAMRDLSMA